MLIRMADGRSTFIDFRERAPEKASRNMYLDAQGRADEGQHRRLAIVGRAGHGARLRDGGQRNTASSTWAENMAPAVELASKGFPVSYALAEGLKGSRSLASDRRSRSASSSATARSTRSARRSCSPSWRRRSQRISKNGANEFYEGETAKRFAEEMAKHGGLITLADLKNYKAIERTPLHGHVQGLHDHHLAAVELRRHRAARDARAFSRAPATKRPAPARRRRSTTRPKRCAAPTPTATSTSAIRTS